jgi:putative addiction module component (TIGR02574 family)
MTVKSIVEEAKKLSPAEQAELLDEMICLVGDYEADVSLTPAQREDLLRRAEEWRSGNAETVEGDRAFEQLRKRR